MFEKIVCIGDSITKGKVWKENERRPYITERSYPLVLKDILHVDVFNGGVCDLTSSEMLHLLENGMEIDKGSAVIVEIGGNDCNLNWREIKKDPDGAHDAVVPLNDFRQNLKSIVGIIKDIGALPILSTLPPLDADRYYNLLKRVFGDGIKRWIDRNGGIYRWQERYSNVIRDMANSMGIYLIDIRQSFLNTADYRSYMSMDGIHPNEDGYTLIADTCSRELKMILN